jgi:hypothetical protein
MATGSTGSEINGMNMNRREPKIGVKTKVGVSLT